MVNSEALLIAGFAALGPTIAALAAWRQAKGTRTEVTTNNGKRAGDYLEMMGQLSADMHIMKIEGRLTAARLAKKMDRLHTEHGELLACLDDRLSGVESRFHGPDQGKGQIAL